MYFPNILISQGSIQINIVLHIIFMADVQDMANTAVKLMTMFWCFTLVEGHKSKALHYNLYHMDTTPHSNWRIRHKY